MGKSGGYTERIGGTKGERVRNSGEDSEIVGKREWRYDFTLTPSRHSPDEPVPLLLCPSPEPAVETADSAYHPESRATTHDL